MKQLGVALLLIGMISLTASTVGLATFYRYDVLLLREPILAAVIAIFGSLPPLWFSTWFTQGPVKQLAVVAWRFGSLMPALLIYRGLEGPERNCFLYSMLACYFVALSLESWHFIREAHASGDSGRL